MDVKEITGQIKSGAVADVDGVKQDVNTFVAGRLSAMREEITSLCRTAVALPKEAAVALETVIDSLFRSAEAIVSHPVTLDGETSRTSK